MLFLHRNNRMELLLEELGQVLSVPRREVFRPEMVVVQSLGMERWVSMGLAERFGIWANGEYPFPRAFIESISDSVIGELPASARYTRDTMAYHLAAILAELPADSALSSLAGYLATRQGVAARLELAEQLADAFDQVQIFRPDWLLAWASRSTEETPDDFRPELFRLLSARLGEQHFPARMARLIERLSSAEFEPSVLPERVSLFGVASLPPAFIRAIDALGRHIQVDWFLLTASREYLGSEPSRRELARHNVALAGERSGGAGKHSGARLWSEQPLLASYGRIMRDIGLLLEEDCHYIERSQLEFVVPETTSVLQTLQADLCNLVRRGLRGEAPRLTLADDDRSLEIHACHGPRRQLEVLHGLLLDAFERDPTLRPEDVIVLLRDVDTFAPLVDAVFFGESGRVGHIPYTLADRSLGSSNAVAECVIALLESAQWRMTSAELLQLFELRPVQLRFEIDVGELPKIRDWLRELHVSWGVDLDERARAGKSGQREHTLRFGLSRLVLGAALELRSGEPWKGQMPLALEGDEVALAGRLVEGTEAIFAWRERATRDHSFAEWHAALVEASAMLFAVESATAWQLADLLETVERIRNEAEGGGFTENVPASVLSRKLRAHYENNRSAQALLSGGVTFCAMLPMRGIPARIVAMIGLDDGSFPRAVAVSSFDEVARSPSRAGDRVGRDEDRHLFLETLLAARERLIITFEGRNPRDDSIRPESVVVDELLAVVDDSYELMGHPELRASTRLRIEHPIHSHSARYFDGSDARLRPSARLDYAAARALERSRFLPAPGMQQALAATTVQTLSLDALERFWSTPGEYFLQQSVGAALTRELPTLAALDPIELDALGRHQLTTELVRCALEGSDERTVFARWTAAGCRPHANLGKVIYEEQRSLALAMANFLRRLGASARSTLTPIRLQLSGIDLHGIVTDRLDGGRIDWSPATLKAKHRVLAWLRHLVLAVAGYPAVTWIVRRNSKSGEPLQIERLPQLPSGAARRHLEQILTMYCYGQRAPLAFFPDAAWDYAQRIHRGESTPVALEHAIRQFTDPWEAEDHRGRRASVAPELMRLFGAEPPLTDAWPARFGLDGFPSFADAALGIFGPYLDSVETIDSSEIGEIGEADNGREPRAAGPS